MAQAPSTSNDRSCCLQILKVPDACEFKGKGPLLSARQYDNRIIWQRAVQLGDLSRYVWPLYKLQVNCVSALVSLMGCNAALLLQFY